MANKIIEDFKAKENIESLQTQSIGKCPACRGDVIENKRAFGCSNWKNQDGGCKFTIWKEIAKKQISKEHAKQLLEHGETEKIQGFTSKKETKFDAALKIVNENDAAYKVVFNFS